MTGTRGRRIYHLMTTADWARERNADGPIAADQLERHGFVHCCTREQILEIATWWLADDSPLVAIEVEADHAGDVRFERADLGREYPHVYNPLPRSAVTGTFELPQGGDGRLVLPADLADPPPAFLIDAVAGGRDVHLRWQAGVLTGDEQVRAAADAKVLAGEQVAQFPAVDGPASLATPYEAFCLIASSVDDIRSYHGDGFFDDER